MLLALVLFAACAGETTAPDAPGSSNPPSAPLAPPGFSVVPGTVTIEINQQIRFRGEVRTPMGEVYSPSLSWEATGGSIDAEGNFFAHRPGTYRVVGRGYGRGGHRGRVRPERPDTSVVVVVPRQPGLVRIRVTPRAPRLRAGATRTFTAMGRLEDGSAVPIGVTWEATGGTIDAAGVFQAGSERGVYRVIATDTRGRLADTVRVRIRRAETTDTASTPTNPGPVPVDSLPDPVDPTPDPGDPNPDPVDPDPVDPDPVDPTPEPRPTLARVVVRPATVVLPTRATHRFAAFGRNTVGDSVAVDVTFRATGGSITSTGLYTAGPTQGSYRVIATANGFADTALISLLPASSGGGTGRIGVPFGASQLVTRSGRLVPLNASLDGYDADNIVRRLAEARDKKMHLLMNMTGGSHSLYMTNGVFDMAKWRAKMDRYNTTEIRAAVAAAVEDGTIIGNSVMDEPHASGVGAIKSISWGPEGTMTKARIDEMCGYVKQIFPTLPVGVVHQHHRFERSKSYRVCDFIVSQFNYRALVAEGGVEKFRDNGLALARRDGHAIAFSINVLNGGIPSARDGSWHCPVPATGGRGQRDPLCRVSPEQLREWALVLGRAGCAMNMWRYDNSFFNNPENQAALRDVADALAKLPRTSCRRP
jgi:hypothetical protein